MARQIANNVAGRACSRQFCGAALDHPFGLPHRRAMHETASNGGSDRSARSQSSASPTSVSVTSGSERHAREMRDLVARARLGGWFYLGGWVLVVAMGGAVSQWPVLCAGIAFAFLALALARRFARVPSRPSLRQSARALARTWSVVFVGTLLWAAVSSWVLLLEGDSEVGMVALLCSVAFATAMAHTFCMRPARAAACIGIALVPLVFVLWQVHGLQGLATALAVYLGYLALSLLRSHLEYADRLRLEDELTAQRDRFELQSRHDELTGLANRRRFEAELAALTQAAVQRGVPFALLVIDLDHFKQVNDRLGHAGGDACLVQFAERLRRHFDRPGETSARVGGEEFAVLLPRVALDQAQSRAESLRSSLQASPLMPAEGLPNVTVSVGVSGSAMGAGATADEIYRAADQALYQAKEQGRNAVVAAAPGESGREQDAAAADGSAPPHAP